MVLGNGERALVRREHRADGQVRLPDRKSDGREMDVTPPERSQRIAPFQVVDHHTGGGMAALEGRDDLGQVPDVASKIPNRSSPEMPSEPSRASSTAR